ncbi:hypothetical protein EV702DRAFT_1234203 [Suillus placidus]|uniref:RFTS domain-containing protein n=1 Tax=Suillus placidus TaxID=48579 RepID=A0A9P6ZF27_9AGAM|nr:hypothetical protein EV702DRAFT_1234203 [Suillus placidus]
MPAVRNGTDRIRPRNKAYDISFPDEKPAVDGNSTVPVQGKLYRPPRELLPEATCFPVKRLDGGQTDTVVLLERFVFFDSSQHMLLLSRLDDHSEIDVYGAGIACLEGHEPRSVRIGPIQSYDVDLADPDGAMHVNTERARYCLGIPSKKYRSQFRKTFLPHRIIQTIVSSAIRDPGREYKDFLAEFLKMKIVGDPPHEGDIWDCVKQLGRAVETIAGNPRHAIMVDFLLSNTAPPMKRVIEPPRRRTRKPKATIEREVIDLTLED